MSKVPLAYIAMKMVEEGKLDLMKPVYQYWADYTVGDGYVVLDDEATIAQKDAENAMLARFADDTAKAKAKLITSKMILLHTTGLDNGTYSGIKAVDDGNSSTWEWLREPDYTTYLYSGPAIHILDMTLGKILGKDLKDYSIDYIFDKVGIVHANYLWQDEYSSIAAIGHRENGTWSTSSSWNGTNAAYTLRTSTEEYTKFLKWINTGADFTDKSNYDAMFAKYDITLYGEQGKIISALESYENLEQAVVTKVTKKGQKDINLKELIGKIEITDKKAEEVTFTAIYPAGTPLNINPQLLLDFIKENYGVEVIDAFVIRKNLFDKDMKILQ